MGLSIGWMEVPADVQRALQEFHRVMAQVDEEQQRLRRLGVDVDDPASPDPRVIAVRQRYDAAWEAFERANRSEFAMGAVRMSACLAVMLQAGMVVNVSRPVAPSRAAYPDEAAYNRALDAYLRDRCGAAVIPAHKFCSSEGWLVSPQELRAALRHAPEVGRHPTTGELLDWWVEWVEFLRGGSTHGGIHVS
jgi:hypothetical protein